MENWIYKREWGGGQRQNRMRKSVGGNVRKKITKKRRVKWMFGVRKVSGSVKGCEERGEERVGETGDEATKGE